MVERVVVAHPRFVDAAHRIVRLRPGECAEVASDFRPRFIFVIEGDGEPRYSFWLGKDG